MASRAGKAGRAPVEVSGRAGVRRIEDRVIATLPASASDRLPSRGQVAVRGRVCGVDVDLVLEPDGRKGHWIALDDVATAGLADGDSLDFTLTVAEEWPEPQAPDDLVAALDGESTAARTWQDITPMARWEWVRWIDATKNPQTRDRRVEVSVDKLRKGNRRPCCFDLSSCTDPEVSRSGKLIEP